MLYYIILYYGLSKAENRRILGKAQSYGPLPAPSGLNVLLEHARSSRGEEVP